MNFSGVGKRGLAAIAVACAIFTLTSCSSDGQSSLDKAKSSATPTGVAKDQRAVVAVYQRYWGALVKAQNNGNADPKLFRGIADGPFIEVALKQVRDSKAIGVTRRGAPTLDKYAATINGDTATVLACLDESDWKFYGNGKLLKGAAKGGTPVGGKFERRSSAWIMVDTLVSKDIQKVCDS